VVALRAMNSSFGAIDDLAIGDVVLWSKLGLKLTGVISDLRLVMQGGREVAHADVFCFENQKKHDVLCINLKVITKTDVEA